ncbi:MAG: hypothetical protein WBA76_11855 [Phormidesmis sp.]
MENRTTQNHPLLSLSLFILLLMAACSSIKRPTIKSSISQTAAVDVPSRQMNEGNKELETAEAIEAETIVELEKAESVMR